MAAIVFRFVGVHNDGKSLNGRLVKRIFQTRVKDGISTPGTSLRTWAGVTNESF